MKVAEQAVLTDKALRYMVSVFEDKRKPDAARYAAAKLVLLAGSSDAVRLVMDAKKKSFGDVKGKQDNRIKRETAKAAKKEQPQSKKEQRAKEMKEAGKGTKWGVEL